MNIKLGLVLFLVFIRVTASFQLNEAYYDKVPNTFLSAITNCALLTMPTSSFKTKSKNIECLSLCSATPRCSLACNNGSSCFLSKALVAPYWKPVAISQTQTLQQFPGFNCFSSWNFPNDLTTKIVNLTAATWGPPNFGPSFVTDGYFCDAHELVYAGAYLTANNWFQMDMESVYSISSLVVKCKKSTIGNPTWFSKVEARVGNTSGSSTGNFQNNTLLGYYPISATPGEVVTFQSGKPIVGRFISLQCLDVSYFNIGEIKVLGEEI